MHILFLTDNFPPEVNAPASRTFEHCRLWARLGHRVTVITCAPNFPKGRVFDGYRNRLWQRENLDGVTVIRVWTYITANEGFLRRVLDYVSFMKVEKSSYLKIRMDWLFSIYVVFVVAVLVRYLWLLWQLLRGRDPAEGDAAQPGSGL